jgi:hypothetical protein
MMPKISGAVSSEEQPKLLGNENPQLPIGGCHPVFLVKFGTGRPATEAYEGANAEAENRAANNGRAQMSEMRGHGISGGRAASEAGPQDLPGPVR